MASRWNISTFLLFIKICDEILSQLKDKLVISKVSHVIIGLVLAMIIQAHLQSILDGVLTYSKHGDEATMKKDLLTLSQECHHDKTLCHEVEQALFLLPGEVSNHSVPHKV